jgi:DNA-binding MarR family transcriptional regulator
MTRPFNFIQAKHIDSYQTLLVLVFFYQYAHSSFTYAQLAEQLYLGDGPVLDEIIASLQATGLIDRHDNGYKLHLTPETEAEIQQLVSLYQQPVARQIILDQIRHRHPASRG